MPWSATDRRTTSRAALVPPSRWWTPVDSSAEPLVRVMSLPQPPSPEAPSDPVLAAAAPVDAVLAEVAEVLPVADVLPVAETPPGAGPEPVPAVTEAWSRTTVPVTVTLLPS